MKRGRPKKKIKGIKPKEVVMLKEKEVKKDVPKVEAPKNDNVIADPNETLAHEA